MSDRSSGAAELDAALRAGIALYNAGYHHAAHDAWEDYWLDLERGSQDERFLHGLIQFTAAVHHAEARNWEGATGLAASAVGYLEGLGPTYHQVSLTPVRSGLEVLAMDPEAIERVAPPTLRHRDTAVGFADLRFEATAIAARILAAELDTFAVEAIDRALGRAEGPDGERYQALVTDFLRESGRRALVYDRLTALLDRDQQRDRDVHGLFDGTGGTDQTDP